MNENINLTEILKNCPKGTRFFSYIHGQVEFSHIDLSAAHPIYVIARTKFGTKAHETFSEKGLYEKSYNGTCTLVPSLEQPDWSKWVCPKPKKSKFDPKTLQPFDKVLVRDTNHNYWCGDILSHINNDKWCDISFCSYVQVIPYNDETKHLVGTTEEAPEYYRYWED